MAIKLEGTRKFSSIVTKLKKKSRETKNARVVVGFSQRYALFVHENIPANATYRVGQSKFLESTSRLFAEVLAQDITNGVKQGKPLLEVLLETGQVLLNATLDITPMDTGALRESGFVASVKQADAVAAEAFSRSESLRIRILAARKATSGFPLSGPPS